MKTRNLVAILQLCACGLIFAQGDVSKLPQLNALRVEHVNNSSRVTAPLTAEYRRRLETLKQQFTRESRLKEAVAVDNELRKQPASPDDPPELIRRRNEYLGAVQSAIAPLNAAYVQKLEALKSQYTREGKLETALLVDAELAEVRRRVTSDELAIISATYGVIASSRVADVTETLASMLKSGKPTAKLTALGPGAFKRDPAPQTKKRTKITYSIKGFIKEKPFRRGMISTSRMISTSAAPPTFPRGQAPAWSREGKLWEREGAFPKRCALLGNERGLQAVSGRRESGSSRTPPFRETGER